MPNSPLGPQTTWLLKYWPWWMRTREAPTAWNVTGGRWEWSPMRWFTGEPHSQREPLPAPSATSWTSRWRLVRLTCRQHSSDFVLKAPLGALFTAASTVASINHRKGTSAFSVALKAKYGCFFNSIFLLVMKYILSSLLFNVCECGSMSELFSSLLFQTTLGGRHYPLTRWRRNQTGQAEHNAGCLARELMILKWGSERIS